MKNKLQDFKEQVRKFREAILPTYEYWQSNKYKTLITLLQNLGFDRTGVTNYSLTDDEKKTRDILKAIQSIAEYEEGDHFVNYIHEEVDMLYTGLVLMAEE